MPMLMLAGMWVTLMEFRDATADGKLSTADPGTEFVDGADNFP